MKTPQPPITADIQTLHKKLTETCLFLQEMHQTGNKFAGYTQDQINAMTTNQDLGKVVFNTTTNESNISYLDTGVVKWRAI